jgi:hypothetical protein
MPDLPILLRLRTAIASAANRRGIVLGLILGCAGLGYAALAIGLGMDTAPVERQFGEVSQADALQLDVYIEILAIDPVNEAMRTRVSFAPGRTLRGNRPGVADQDLRIRLDDGDTMQELSFPANANLGAVTFEADLHDGTVAAFPLDRFRAELGVVAYRTAGEPIPLHVKLWEGIGGWTLDAEQVPGDPGGAMRLQVGLRRSAALTLLALAIYVVMAMIACAAVTIGALVFLRRRPAESTLIGALGGMLFALPALRYGMLGAPPIGVRADLLVFLWAEMAVALGLILLIIAWAKAATRN